MMPQEGRQAGAGGQQVQALAGTQVVAQQGACGLAAHQDGVANLRYAAGARSGAVLDLDREELEVLFIVGAGDAGAPQQRLAVHGRPIMVKWPFWNRKAWSRVVVKLNSRSVQWCTLSTRAS